MTSETTKVKAKLATLSSSLDDLEAHIAPLFTQSLPELIIALDPIQQAKLQTVLPYLVYDLVFSAPCFHLFLISLDIYGACSYQQST